MIGVSVNCLKFCGVLPFFQMTVEDRVDYEASIHLRSKKVNLNHLLNFSYSYEDSYRERITGRGQYHRGGKGGCYSSFVKYNKEQFLQAK